MKELVGSNTNIVNIWLKTIGILKYNTVRSFIQIEVKIPPFANCRLCVDYNCMKATILLAFPFYGLKIHTFAKIRILCSVIAGREREPRRIVIPGLKEVQPQVEEDLHQQAEVAAEVPGKMKVPDGRILKAVMPKDQHVAHLI